MNLFIFYFYYIYLSFIELISLITSRHIKNLNFSVFILLIIVRTRNFLLSKKNYFETMALFDFDGKLLFSNLILK